MAFHGAIGGAETLRWFIDAFSREFKVVVPSLGTTEDPDLVSCMVDAILEKEGIERAALFGISLGGLVAQAFVESHPHRVTRVVVISSSAPKRVFAFVYGMFHALTRLAPLSVIHACARLFLTGPLTPNLPAAGASPIERRLLRDRRWRLRRYATTVEREFVLARLRLTEGLHARAKSIHTAFQSWKGEVLLLVAANDPTIGVRRLRETKDHFPRLRLHTFPDGGHMIPLYHADELRRVVTEFLAAE